MTGRVGGLQIFQDQLFYFNPAASPFGVSADAFDLARVNRARLEQLKESVGKLNLSGVIALRGGKCGEDVGRQDVAVGARTRHLLRATHQRSRGGDFPETARLTAVGVGSRCSTNQSRCPRRWSSHPGDPPRRTKRCRGSWIILRVELERFTDLKRFSRLSGSRRESWNVEQAVSRVRFNAAPPQRHQYGIIVRLDRQAGWFTMEASFGGAARARARTRTGAPR